jgi:hypothetical protein
MGSAIQDVDHIKLETDRLLHGITRDDTTLSQASVMEYFLRTATEEKINYVGDQKKLMDVLVEHKAAKYCKAAI